MGGCQNYGPLLGTLNIRCRTIIGTQKGTIVLTTTHMKHNFHFILHALCHLLLYLLKNPIIIPLKQIEYGFGYVLISSPYTPYSIYFRGTIHPLSPGTPSSRCTASAVHKRCCVHGRIVQNDMADPWKILGPFST